MRMEIGASRLNDTDPAASSVKRLASLAYATDDMTSDEKTGSAFHFGSRSVSSSSDGIGRPNSTRRAPAMRRPHGVEGALASSLAARTPGPV